MTSVEVKSAKIEGDSRRRPQATATERSHRIGSKAAMTFLATQQAPEEGHTRLASMHDATREPCGGVSPEQDVVESEHSSEMKLQTDAG